MQTIIDTLLIVIGNIPGIDETVYANIYDIELTDKTVFVIVPGDISENITAYLVNGSILLMSKVMLVLKSKYMETNIVITSNDNIKEFSLDNCSGVYNVIKYKRIYKREYCGDSYEGMFVKSVNGLHGEVFLDIPLKISDLPNDAGYITEYVLPDYTDKLNEIDSSILDVSNRVFYIEADYVKQGDLPDYTDKFNEIDSSILDVSTRVHDIEADYVKHGELPIIPDYTDKFNLLDSSISNVSTRVHYIENDYVKHGELPILPDYADKFNLLDSSILDVSTRVYDIENDYVKHNELPIIHDYTDKFNEIDSSILDVSTRVHYIEADYVKHNELPDYTDKFNEIDSSILDVSTRVHDIEADYVKHNELPILPDYTDKFNEIDSSISNVSTRVNYIENDYVKHNELPDYTDKFNEIDSSISNVSTRVHNIENDYTTREYVDLKISEIVILSGVSSVNGMTGDVVLDIPSKVSDLLNDSNFISRQEAEDLFAKKGDVPTDVYTTGQIDQKFIQTAQRIIDVSTKVNNVSTNLNNEVSRLDLRIDNVSSNIPSLTDYAKTIYVDQKVQDVSTFVSDNFAKKSDIPTDYVRESEYLIKILEIESDISTFVDSSFVESENEKTLNSAKSYTDGQILLLETDVSSKISKLNVSINNEFNRIWDENYVKHDEIADFATKTELADYYLKSNGEAIESRVGTIESDITTINSSLQSYNTRITDNELKNVDQDSSISRLNTSVNTLESSILTKQEILVSGTNIKTINGNDILGEGNIEIQGGGGSGYTKEEVDKMFSDSSKYVSNNYVKQSYGSFTFLNDYPLSLYSSYAGSTWRYDIKVGKYEKDGATVNDIHSIVFNFNEYGKNNNGIYMFCRGKIYAKMAAKFSSNIENDRLASMADLNEKLGDINTILESI